MKVWKAHLMALMLEVISKHPIAPGFRLFQHCYTLLQRLAVHVHFLHLEPIVSRIDVWCAKLLILCLLVNLGYFFCKKRIDVPSLHFK
jgi:hypothetical protein